MVPTWRASSATAALSRTSSGSASAMPLPERSESPFASMSVATTWAPSRAKANADALPIPAAAAVTNARLPSNLSGIGARSSMRMPRRAEALDNVVVAGREFEAGAGRLLPYGRAVELLPRRVMLRICIAAICLKPLAALGEIRIGHQDVRAALAEVDADAVPGFEQSEAAASRGLRRGVEDRGRARGAGLSAVADARQGRDPAFDQRGRRLHVHHLRPAGIADRPCAADEQDTPLVDAERRVLDASVVVLRTIEHHCAALESIRIARVGQIAVAELLRDHAGLHDRAVEQVALEHDEAGLLGQRILPRADHVTVRVRRRAAIVPDGATVDGHRVLVDAAVPHQLAHHSRHAASTVVLLPEIDARRLQVDEEWHVETDLLPVLDRKLDADVAGERIEMNRRVGRAADRGVDHDRVLERLVSQDVGGFQVLANHFDDTPARLESDLAALAVGRGDRSAARQRHAERFGERVHRGRR